MAVYKGANQGIKQAACNETKSIICETTWREYMRTEWFFLKSAHVHIMNITYISVKGECPENYPHPSENNKYCCQHNIKINDTTLDPKCDGTHLGVDDPKLCCSEYQLCPSTNGFCSQKASKSFISLGNTLCFMCSLQWSQYSSICLLPFNFCD